MMLYNGSPKIEESSIFWNSRIVIFGKENVVCPSSERSDFVLFENDNQIRSVCRSSIRTIPRFSTFFRSFSDADKKKEDDLEEFCSLDVTL